MAWLVRLLNPLVWRRKAHAARKLYQFSLAEHGSMIDLQLAARLTACPKRAALYLRHASDEQRHARLFWQQSSVLRDGLGKVAYPRPQADTEHLFENLGEVLFLAFVHYGERRARIQFEGYIEYFQRKADKPMLKLFLAIVPDEIRHETYTGKLLEELAGSQTAGMEALRKVARWEWWRRWRRMGRSLVLPVYRLSMWIVYLGLLPMVALARILRPFRPGWRRLPP